MPLRDHFRPPLFPLRSYASFHSRWANSIADALQRTLPPHCFAEVQIHLGTNVEADVAEFEGSKRPEAESGNGPANGGAVATAVQPWAPPAPPLTLPAVYPDEVEVQVRDERDDARLVAVVELVSPRNLDRADARRGFAAKCVAYLQRGIGLVMTDIVTNRQFNLHDEVMRLLEAEERFLMPGEPSLYAVAYRPTRRNERDEIDMWPHALAVGGALPVLPLALRGARAVPLDLEATYTDACQRSRLEGT